MKYISAFFLGLIKITIVTIGANMLYLAFINNHVLPFAMFLLLNIWLCIILGQES